MAFILDNLTAILVGTTLLVALLFVQQRGSHAAVDASVRYQTEAQATTVVETLARDLENARTREQARTALGAYANDSLGGPTVRALGLHPFAGSPETEWIQFVTLADPDASADADPTTTSDLIAVAYRLIPTGEQVMASGELRDLHRLVRYVFDGTVPSPDPDDWVAQNVSPPTVIGFRVQAVPGGLSGRITDLPPRVDVTVEMAFEAPRRQAADQAATVETGLTRQGATARLYAAGTGNLALPSVQGSPFVPRVPWIGPPPPPSPPGPSGPGPSGPGPGSPGPSGPSPGGGGPPSGPAPPPFDTTGTSGGGL